MRSAIVSVSVVTLLLSAAYILHSVLSSSQPLSICIEDATPESRQALQRLDELYGSASFPRCHVPDFRIVFVVHPSNFGSGYMRGHGLIAALGNATARATSPSNATFLRGDHICIIIKTVSRARHLCDQCHQVGAVCVLDILDDHNWPSAVAHVDAFLVGSHAEAAFVRARLPATGPKPRVVVVAHGHTNDIEPLVQLPGQGLDPVRVVGDVHSSQKVPLLSTQSILRRVAEQFNASYVPYELVDGSYVPRTGLSYYPMAFQRTHHDFTRLVDIAVVAPPALPLPAQQLLYHENRPLTRFIYWMSHGVPTLALESPAYRELTDALNLTSELFVASPAHLEHALTRLILDRNLRHRISTTFLAAASRFSFTALAQVYRRALCALLP